MNLFSHEFFQTWETIRFPADETSLWDSLMQQSPNDWYVIDYLPEKIQSIDDYLKVEVRYGENDVSEDKPSYLSIETRFLNVLTTLWEPCTCLSETEVSSETLLLPPEQVKASDISHNGDKLRSVVLDNAQEFRHMCQLSLQEKASALFFFAGKEIIVWVSGLSAVTFAISPQVVAQLNSLVAANGLYLRHRED